MPIFSILSRLKYSRDVNLFGRRAHASREIVEKNRLRGRRRGGKGEAMLLYIFQLNYIHVHKAPPDCCLFCHARSIITIINNNNIIIMIIVLFSMVIIKIIITSCFKLVDRSSGISKPNSNKRIRFNFNKNFISHFPLKRRLTCFILLIFKPTSRKLHPFIHSFLAYFLNYNDVKLFKENVDYRSEIPRQVCTWNPAIVSGTQLKIKSKIFNSNILFRQSGQSHTHTRTHICI